MIALVAAQLIYASLTYHRDRARVVQRDSATSPRRPLAIIGLFMLLTWLAVGFDYYDRHRKTQDNTQDGYWSIISGWGVEGKPYIYHIEVDTKSLITFRDDWKLMLLVRVNFTSVDRMADTRIEKSELYTITGEPIALAHVSNNKLIFNLDNKNEFEFNLILLPSRFSPDQIRSLADVERLGGKIVDVKRMDVVVPRAPSSLQQLIP